MDGFSDWLMNRGHIKYAASARCNECRAKSLQEEQEQRNTTVALVVKQDTACQTCKQCKTTLPDANFSLWRLQYGTGKRSLETCDSCMDYNTVAIYCPTCSRMKIVDINLFWKRTACGHRFVEQRCGTDNCHKNLRLNKWLRRRNEKENAITAWLQHNKAMTQADRPHTMTIKLYNEQVLRQDSLQNTTHTVLASDSLKRSHGSMEGKDKTRKDETKKQRTDAAEAGRSRQVQNEGELFGTGRRQELRAALEESRRRQKDKLPSSQVHTPSSQDTAGTRRKSTSVAFTPLKNVAIRVT